MNWSALIYVGGMVLSRLGSVLLIPVYTRELSPTEYGQYALVMSVLQLLPYCASLGLIAGLGRGYFEKSREDADNNFGGIARGMIAIVGAMLLAVSILLITSAPPVLWGIEKAHWGLVCIGSIGIVAAIVPDIYFRSNQRAWSATFLQIGSFVPTLLLGIIFVRILKMGLDGALLAATFSAVLSGVYGMYFTLRKLPAGDVREDTKRAIGYSLPFVPHFLANWAQTSADRWVLSAFGGNESLGNLFLATQLLSPVSLITGAYNSAESPRLGEIYRAGGIDAAYAALPRLCIKYFVVTLLPFLGILLVSPLLPQLVGEKFIGAASFLPLVGLAMVVDSQYFPLNNYVFFAGRTSLIPVVTVGSAVFGVGLSIVLMPAMGISALLVSRLAGAAMRALAMLGATIITKRSLLR